MLSLKIRNQLETLKALLEAVRPPLLTYTKRRPQQEPGASRPCSGRDRGGAIEAEGFVAGIHKGLLQGPYEGLIRVCRGFYTVLWGHGFKACLVILVSVGFRVV